MAAAGDEVQVVATSTRNVMHHEEDEGDDGHEHAIASGGASLRAKGNTRVRQKDARKDLAGSTS